jgi:hypothetical protein
VRGMRTVDRETRRDLSGRREGRRSSPATASLAKIWQMIACGNVLVWAGGRESVEWSGGEGGEGGGGVWRARWWK